MTYKCPKNEYASELALAQAAGSGDREAQRQVIEKLLPRVRSTVFYLAGHDRDKDDCIQLSLVEVLHSLRGFQGTAKLTTWADRITVRTTLRHLKTRRRKERKLAEEFERGDAPFYSEQNEGQQRAHLVRKRLVFHLEKLNPKLRAPVVLKLLSGYSVDEIVDILEIPRDTVKGRLKRGRGRLKKAIQMDPLLMEWVAARIS